MSHEYSLNRSQAADILQVSERTVDRYVRSKKLSCNKIGKKIFLSRKEVDKLAVIRNKMRVDLEYAKNAVDKVDKNVDSDVENAAREGLGRGMLDKNVDIENEHKKSSVVDKVDILDKVDKNVDSDVKNAAREGLGRGMLDKNVDIENDEDKLYSEEDLTSKKAGTNFVVSVYKSLYDEAVSELKVKQKQLEGANYRVGQLESQIKSMVPLLEYRKEQKKLLLLGEQHEEEKKQFNKQLTEKESELKKERLNRVVISVVVFVFIVAQPIFWYLWKLSHG